MTRDEFLRLNPVNPHKSKLEPFWEDIVELRKAGMPYSNIAKFLAINGVEVTTAGLSDYVRRHALESTDAPADPPPTAKPTKPQTAKAKPQTEAKAQTPPAQDVFELAQKPEVDMSFDT